MYITDDIRYIGVNDRKIDLFEGQYPVKNGMAYNSYVILDEKIAVFDTVDRHFSEEWLDNLSRALEGRTPDYLIVQHMEPDHSANIALFAEKYPSATLVASVQAFAMMKQYFGDDFASRRIVAADGATLPLGRHTLTFFTAPMVHWPEVIVTFDAASGTLFSADAFGKFGATDTDEPWDDEARRYYIGIVGKFGLQVQKLLSRLSGLEIQTICPLHGPVLKENLARYVRLYDLWSSYTPEEEGVLVAYTSVYGNTEKAALYLADALRQKGVKTQVYDLARSDIFGAVAAAFRFDKTVLATTTYNGGVFPFMYDFLHHLTERNFQKRTVAIVENGFWAPSAAKTIRKILEQSKDLSFVEPTVTLRSSFKEENREQIDRLAETLSARL